MDFSSSWSDKSTRTIDLTCHPTTPSDEVGTIRVAVSRIDARLELSFRVEGDVPRICITPDDAHQSLVELWRHTCFEIFVAIEGLEAYHEFNLAPVGHWRVYAFRANRDPDLADLPLLLESPIVGVRVAKQSLELDARVALADLSPIHPDSPLRLGLSAVIEPVHGRLSFWAIINPAARPDFHHPEAFALRLEVPSFRK